MLHTDSALLRPWTQAPRAAFPGSFRAGIGTLLGQVSRQRGVPAAKIKTKDGTSKKTCNSYDSYSCTAVFSRNSYDTGTGNR